MVGSLGAGQGRLGTALAIQIVAMIGVLLVGVVAAGRLPVRRPAAAVAHSVESLTEVQPV